MEKEKYVMEDFIVSQSTKKRTVPSYSNINEVDLADSVGDFEKRGIQRIQDKEFTYSFLLADLDFNQDRRFTNYSGDVSGRFVEVMSLASQGDIHFHPALQQMMEVIPILQKHKGHFGAEVDWKQPIDKADFCYNTKMMPIFWGSCRMLLGLIESWLTFGDPSSLDAAKKLGDFYVDTADCFCDSSRLAEYQETGSYAGGYVTCYFPGMEGLAKLYEVTKEQKYVDQAERMAAFRHECGFDKLPLEHFHGYLSSEFSLLLLHSLTGKADYLAHVEKEWEDMMEAGYVGPCGGVLEKAWIGYDRDEGCAVADWLRLNLELWRLSGKGRYLNMAGRSLFNHFAANQCKTGGFGQRFMQCDHDGQIGYGKYIEEALWCCGFHGSMVTQTLKRYLTTGDNETLRINLPVDFSASVNIGIMELVVKQHSVETNQTGVLLKQRIDLIARNSIQGEVFVAIHLPDWADGLSMEDSEGKPIPLARDENYVQTARKVALGQWIYVAYTGGLAVENRRCVRMELTDTGNRVEDVVLRYGPLVMTLKDWREVPVLIMSKSSDGKGINLPEDFYVPVLKCTDIKGKSATDLVHQAINLQLSPQGAMSDETESIFVFDLMFKVEY